MAEPPTVAVVDSDVGRRNRVARLFYDISRHVEPFETVDELQGCWPEADILLVHDDSTLGRCLEAMFNRGSWFPIIASGADPPVSRVADAILMGAMDYLAWPTTAEVIESRLRLLATRSQSISGLRQRVARSRQLVASLTPREREVLFCLAGGATNKIAARQLQLSPRTVEIHRANMMGKLGATHLGEAVSLAVYSDLTVRSPGDRVVDPLICQP
jgi:FixJ family two-component response regulator